MKRFIPGLMLISILVMAALGCRISSLPLTQADQPPTPETLVITPPSIIGLPEQPLDLEYQDTLLTSIYEKVNPGIVSIQVISQGGQRDSL